MLLWSCFQQQNLNELFPDVDSCHKVSQSVTSGSSTHGGQPALTPNRQASERLQHLKYGCLKHWQSISGKSGMNGSVRLKLKDNHFLHRHSKKGCRSWPIPIALEIAGKEWCQFSQLSYFYIRLDSPHFSGINRFAMNSATKRERMCDIRPQSFLC